MATNGNASSPSFNAQQLDTLRSGGWFPSLPDPLQEALIRSARPLALKAGRCLFAKGDAADGLYAVLEGAVRITSISAAGKEAILAIVEPPLWFGEIALFDSRERTHDAWAETDAQLMHVPLKALHTLLETHPAYWRDFGRLLTHKLRTAFEAMEDAALLPSGARLARRLLSISAGYGERRDGQATELRIPQEQLGSMVSLSRQTTNQILRQFEIQGAIRLSRGGIQIVDRTVLETLAAVG